MRNKILIIGLISSTIFAFGFDFSAIKDRLKQEVSSATTKTTSTSQALNLDNATISAGLKEALKSGVTYAINTLGAENGFLNNSLVKIPLPENIAKIETLIRKAGANKLADDLITSMNSAATQAVPKTAEIFLDTIDGMTLEDAKKILTQGDSAATDYFKANSQTKLKATILPIIQNAMRENKVATYYDKANEFYKTNLKERVENSKLMGLAKDFGGDAFMPTDESDLDEYVTQKAIDGLFVMIQSKEEAIRTDTKEQTTALLKKVFGGLL